MIPRELGVIVQRGEPEGELVGEVVARAATSATLDEGRGPEVLETRSGTGKDLAATSCAGTGVLQVRKRY